MPKMIINGRYLARTITGQERFAREIVSCLDELSYPDEFEIICPTYSFDIPEYSNIRVVKKGSENQNIWEQTTFKRAIKKCKLTSLNLTTTCSMKYPGVVCVHDLLQEVHPEWFRTTYSLFSNKWHKWMMDSVVKSGKALLTVSEFSKKEILSVRHFDRKILVLGNGWEHIKRIKESFDLCQRYQLQPHTFFFSLGSLTPQKNISWIYEVAVKNPSYIFVIAGSKSKLSGQSKLERLRNVIEVGRISDAQIKGLMLSCLAYISPSIHEGFGIPPLEALACGAKLILSDIEIYHEIFGDAAYYFNPCSFDISFEKAISYSPIGIEKILSKYSWATIAKTLLAFLRDNNYFYN